LIVSKRSSAATPSSSRRSSVPRPTYARRQQCRVHRPERRRLVCAVCFLVPPAATLHPPRHGPEHRGGRLERARGRTRVGG